MEEQLLKIMEQRLRKEEKIANSIMACAKGMCDKLKRMSGLERIRSVCRKF